MRVLEADEMHEMYHISVREFSEFVRVSDSWSDLARRCGQTGTLKQSIRTNLKQKVSFLKLDTQHFMGVGMQWMQTARARRAWITERVGAVGTCGLGDVSGSEQMCRIAPEDFSELVRHSHSWSDLARRCGARAKPAGGFCVTMVTVLKKKVLFLKLETEHFTKNIITVL